MTKFTTAAKELLSRRVAGTKAPRLDASIRPESLDDSFAIQTEMAKLAVVRGWKCLLPPAADKVIAAPIFNVQKDTDVVELFEDNGVARLEPEICFVLAKDLPTQDADYSADEIIDAIGSAHMALELMQSRYADDAEQSYYEALADCMLNQGAYVGPQIDKAAAINASEIKITVTDETVRELAGVHPNPRAIDGVLWLINYMSKRGVSFNAGEAMITGSFKGIVDMSFDQPTTIAYEGLGEYTVTFKRPA